MTGLVAVCVLCMAPLIPDVPTVTTIESRQWLRLQSAAQMREYLSVPQGVTNELVVALLSCATVEEMWVVLELEGYTPPQATWTWDSTELRFDSTTNTFDQY
jgi:hypothetical protein